MMTASEVDPSRRLIVRLTKFGELERVLEFHAESDGARVIGCAPSSDIVLRDAGVLPVHCYFERDLGSIWLAAAQDAANVRLNYRPIIGRVRLPARSILEIGEARMQILVLEADGNAPHHGLFGTEVILPSGFADLANRFTTTPVDVALVLGDLVTGAWPKFSAALPDAVASPAVPASISTATLEYQAWPEQRSLADSGAAFPSAAGEPPAAFEPLTTTVRILRPDLPGASAAEPIRPVVPSPCILVQPQRPSAEIASEARLELPSVTREEQDAREMTVASDAPHVLPDANALPQEQPPSTDSIAPTVAASAPPPMTAAFLADPGSFTTVGHPISDQLTAEERVTVSRSSPSDHRVVSSFALHRQRFAAGVGRDPKVIGVIALCTALSLGALIKQSVRAWRQVAVPVVTGTSNRASAMAVHAPVQHGDSSPGALLSAPSSTLAARADDVMQSSEGDALVAQAVNHLLLGEQGEAAEAYRVLAVRYPSEPVYATIAKILRRRLSLACRDGSTGQCGKKVAP